MTTITVAEYVVERLADLGINHAFGVPGDYAFPFDDAIESSARMSWVLNANELNAAYAADAYARLRGAAILTTTLQVGELSALNGVMGARAHRVPIFHLVGSMSTRIRHLGLTTHHTLGDGSYDSSIPLSAAACCTMARLTPDNVVEEMERVIREAFHHSMPAYLHLPQDFAVMPAAGKRVKGRKAAQVSRGASNQKEVKAAVKAIVERIRKATRPVAMPTIHAKRYGALKSLLAFLDRSGMPFANTMLDKGTVDESHPQYLGLYAALESVPASAGDAVLGADLVLCIGELLEEDFNVSAWSAMIDPSRKITIAPDHVRVGEKIFTACMLPDVLAALAKATPRVARRKIATPKPAPLVGKVSDRLTIGAFYTRLQRFLTDGDTLIGEGGSSIGYCAQVLLPKGVGFEGQGLWGSIGWATPAALGACMARTKGRTILVTGDGAHQLTANELGVMGRYGVNPIIFLSNNGIFGAEDVASKRGDVYDDLAQWNYHTVPAAMGCKNWFCVKVKTVGELEEAMARARKHRGASFIEMVIPSSESQPLPRSVLDRQYKKQTPR